MAPGLGLLLDETIFDHYNQRYEREKSNRGMSAQSDVHVTLSLSAIADQVDAFKKTTIYPYIVQEELTNRPFGEWSTHAAAVVIDSTRAGIVAVKSCSPTFCS